mmetsp:Transcript_36487/g.41015  ORF Transcript_36487/g.41015 Transcript_36487/m.41015 type:complete len:164 (+) Transcript_36487:444-935(+)
MTHRRHTGVVVVVRIRRKSSSSSSRSSSSRNRLDVGGDCTSSTVVVWGVCHWGNVVCVRHTFSDVSFDVVTVYDDSDSDTCSRDREEILNVTQSHADTTLPSLSFLLRWQQPRHGFASQLFSDRKGNYFCSAQGENESIIMITTSIIIGTLPCMIRIEITWQV